MFSVFIAPVLFLFSTVVVGVLVCLNLFLTEQSTSSLILNNTLLVITLLILKQCRVFRVDIIPLNNLLVVYRYSVFGKTLNTIPLNSIQDVFLRNSNPGNLKRLYAKSNSLCIALTPAGLLSTRVFTVLTKRIKQSQSLLSN